MMDAEIDRLIEEELSKLGISEDDLENYAEEDLPLSGDDSDIEADIPESVLTYFEAARDRVSVFERDIHDNQESDGDAAVWRTTPIPCCHSDPLLMELAASAGDEDPAALKQRIMCELEEQLCFTTEHTHSEAAQDPNGTAQEDRGTAQVDSTVVAGGPCEQEPEQRSPHDNLEELERRSPHHDLEKLERRLREEDEELEELERRLREEDEKLDRRLVEEEMRRRRQQEAQRQQHLLTQQEEQESRRRRQQQAEEELRRIEEEHTQRPPEDEEQQREEQMEKREQELARQQEVIRRLAVEVEEERRAFEEARREQRRRKQQQQHQAATTIQAAVKGLITRRWSRPAIKQRREEDRRREEEKRRREEERRQREEERREREDRLRRAQEEEKKRREEEEAQLREEQEKRRRGEREEQERRRKAYEKAKQEERQRLEQERKEEEERRRAEEERRRKDAEEERRRKEAEEKKRWGEEEVKRREEEERRRKEAEEKKRREEEENRRRKEAEKKRQEEEEGVNRQEKDKEEQVKREEEEERKSREDEEQQRRQEEERTRPEEEERQREEERKREVEKEEKRRELEKEERKREEQERKRELNEDIKSIQTENKQEQKVKRVADAERDPIYVRREAHQQTGDGQDPSGTPATLEDKNTHQKDIALGDTDIHQKDSTLGDTDTQQKDIALGDTDTQQKDIALGDTDTQQEAATSPDHLPCDQTQPMTTQPVHTAPAENHTVGQKTPAQQLPHGELLSHRCAGPKYDVYSGVSAAAAAVTVGVSAGSLCLPDAVEQKRLSWMRSCLPWSKMAALCRRKRPPEQGSSRRGRRGARRTQQPSLQPLALDTLLQAGPWNTLSQVTSVSLSDLPGCSLSSLAACPQLRSLTLHRCGINALEGLNTCTHLTHIDLQDNCVSSVDCSGLCGLQVLRLGGNQLTSIHGLQDATQLLHLHLSHNRISRLGGLEGLKRLQVLCVDHNLLTSVRGLDEAFTLQELDLSHNHLTHAHGLEQCALLRTLRLDGNTLTEAPRLGNHVLLGELSLQDNSISSLELLTSSWLPLLHTLHLANNSLTRLPLLSDLISLSYLDLRHNCLSELRSVCESVGQCCYLLELWLDGNPLQQDCNWRSSVVACVPGLLLLDGEQTGEPPAPNATQPSKAPNATQSTAGHPHAMTNTSHHPYTPHAPLGSFRALCKAQLQQLSCLQHTHTAQTSSASSPLEAQLLIGRHGDALFQLAEEQRYAHEYGDTSVTHTQTTHTPSLERAHTPSLDTAPQPVASCTIVHPAQGPLETSCPAPGSMEAHKRPLEVPHLHAAFSMEAHKPPLGVPHSHPAFSMEAHKPPLEVPYSHPAHASMEAAYPAVSSRCPLHAGEVMPASKQQSGHLPSPPHPELRTHRGPHRTDNMELRKRGEESRHTGSMELGRDVDSQHPELDLGDKGSRYTEGWRDGGTHQLNGKDGGQRHTELDLESVAVMDIQKNCLGQQGHTRKCQPGSGHPVADGKCSPAAEAESWGTLPTPLSRQRAATIIQAVWRGHVLRSRLAVALAASSHTHLEDEEEEDEEEDEGLMEVDVDAFDFNEDAVESGWMALRSVGASPCQQWPEVTMPVCVSDRPPLPKVVPPAAVHHSRRPVLLWQPKQAWCGSQETLHPETCIPQRCKSPASAASWDSISARSEKILEEWGFKDSRTAYMMLKRAQRMKTRKQQQGRTRGRAEAGGGSEEEVAQGRRRERRRSSGRSKGYQWIHTQPVTLATPPAPALASPHTCYSERFLPLMSPDVMNGGRVQLVAMTGHRDVEAAGAGREQHHSGSAQQRGGSAPCRRERLSFRDQPVQRSVGWGGGKKRTTRPQN